MAKNENLVKGRICGSISLNFISKNGQFWSKIEIWVKNRNFGRRSKFWSKIEILVKNRNFSQRSKFWSKIEIFVKHRN